MSTGSVLTSQRIIEAIVLGSVDKLKYQVACRLIVETDNFNTLSRVGYATVTDAAALRMALEEWNSIKDLVADSSGS